MKMKVFSHMSFLVFKTAVLTPWIAMAAAAGIFGLPIVVMFSFAVSDDFSEFADSIMDFYCDHLVAISGVTPSLTAGAPSRSRSPADIEGFPGLETRFIFLEIAV